MNRDLAADRRATLATAVVHAGSALAPDPVFAPYARDWDWLVGSWSVRHRKLRARLAGSIQWDEFDGMCTNWPLMGGRGNIDDNILDLPLGRYHGVGVRSFDVETRQWAIWWIDSRTPGIEPPVRGNFTDGVGTFLGDDTFQGQAIKVRFRWTKITTRSAHWDQAFSADSGATWETNWHMDFTRTA